MRSYSLNPEAAKGAGMTSRIEETGRYVGTFTRAEIVTSKKNTEGVEFTFTSTDGRTADYLTCWTYNADGRELYGYKILQAVMTCLRVKNVEPAAMKFTDRDGAPRNANGFPALTGKPIGLLLQREEYEKQDGSIGFKFNIVAPFDPTTGLAAGEILDRKTTAEYIDRILPTLRDKPAQARRDAPSTQYTSSGHPANQRPASSGNGLADLDDDIPFNVYGPRRQSYVL